MESSAGRTGDWGRPAGRVTWCRCMDGGSRPVGPATLGLGRSRRGLDRRGSQPRVVRSTRARRRDEVGSGRSCWPARGDDEGTRAGVEGVASDRLRVRMSGRHVLTGLMGTACVAAPWLGCVGTGRADGPAWTRYVCGSGRNCARPGLRGEAWTVLAEARQRLRESCPRRERSGRGCGPGGPQVRAGAGGGGGGVAVGRARARAEAETGGRVRPVERGSTAEACRGGGPGTVVGGASNP